MDTGLSPVLCLFRVGTVTRGKVLRSGDAAGPESQLCVGEDDLIPEGLCDSHGYHLCLWGDEVSN